jgi:hypothetical protein
MRVMIIGLLIEKAKKRGKLSYMQVRGWFM